MVRTSRMEFVIGPSFLLDILDILLNDFPAIQG
jgi:hypothetical protein